jgi:multidrug transporter EmrE-like cation transporter
MVWFFALSRENLSSGYPILVGATFICATAGAIFFFQESVSVAKVLGMLLIIFGITAIALAP